MWFATQDGLNKYDGKSFTFYNKQFEDVTRPTYSKLGKTYVDTYGDLWIISNSGRLEKFNNSEEAFQTIQAIPDASCIIQSRKKDYFIGTYGKGLFKIENKNQDTLQIFKEQFQGFNIYDIAQYGTKLYVAGSNSVFEIEDSSIRKVEVESSVANFSALAISNSSSIWLGSFGNGLFHKTKASDNFTRFVHSQLPQNLNIQDLLVDRDDRLWIATYGDGVYLLDIDKNTVQHFKANKNDPYAMHYDDVLCMYEDFTGIIWLGTDGAGLSYYDRHLKKFNVITNDQVPINVNVDVTRAIALDDEKTMWLGTSGKGLTSVNRSADLFKTYTTQNSNLSSDRIVSLLYESGELWIGHQGAGLQVMRNGSIETIKNQKKYPKLVVLIAVSMAGAGFCNIFNGDYINMGVAFMSTFIGLLIFQLTHKEKYNVYLRIFSASLIASVLASLGIVFKMGANPETALATSILFLVPGVALINSFTDFLDNNIINGMVRFTTGLMTVLAIALGLFIAMILFQLN